MASSLWARERALVAALPGHYRFPIGYATMNATTMELRGCADRRVANVSMDDKEPILSFGESANMKSSEPIRASS
jgi:hypothetical protein